MKKITSIIAIGSLVVPLISFAQEQAPTDGRPSMRQELRRTDSARRENRLAATSTQLRMASSTKSLGFCSQIDKVIVKIDNTGSTAVEKKAENRESRQDKRDSHRSLVDEKRNENDQKRKEQLAELMRRATTDEQKLAVKTFSEEVEKALTVKKAATDVLIDSHRKEVDQAIEARKQSVDEAFATLRNSIEAAKKKAVADCAAGTSGDSVRTTLKDSIVAAQQVFRNSMQAANKKFEPSKSKDKSSELEVINQTFKKSVEQAKVNLKASFAKNQPTASSTQ